MDSETLRVLHEDNHLLAVAKPVGVPTMGAKPGVTSVLDLAKAYLAAKYDKPGKVYLGVVSRLDAPVTGVLLFARTSKAAGRLTEAFRTREVDKRYLAVVEGEPPEREGVLTHHLIKDERNRRMVATHPGAHGAQQAELSYETLLSHGGCSLLAVRLMTGRKHQIRVQLAKIGCPILGDRKYGAATAYEPGIALHAWRLSLEHPVQREPLALECEPAPRWGRLPAAELARVLADA
ncbi:Ribosomal large subunit pseudouridine synthase A [Botrimarina colliarenosi]|uniref:Ribosomal large subunit pseudouridine synthase A n=1 Tax=Botrimarina colliarenosi TaxID=2528001 RepID=A0A5C6AF56_9BACT|nr:RNA pseudouridine synthase [Botrimarina colliarenosi]TWT98060.1 Ribosomal large subunit pseudouridine synthase A [Botrimarina colliarenosi]